MAEIESGLLSRIRLLVGDGWGTIRHRADGWGIKEATLRQYVSGTRLPTLPQLYLIAQGAGVTLDWLITGEEAAARPEPNRIPILGRPPEASPDPAAEPTPDSPDAIAILLDKAHPAAYLYAIRAADDTMFPTIHPGDLVVVAPLVGLVPGRGELVVVQVEGDSAPYQLRRIGRQSNRRVQLVCDNALHYPPAYLERERVRIRGRLVRALREFTVEEAERAAALAAAQPLPAGEWVPAEDVFVEYHQSPALQEALALVASLDPSFRHTAINVLREIARAGVRLRKGEEGPQ